MARWSEFAWHLDEFTDHEPFGDVVITEEQIDQFVGSMVLRTINAAQRRMMGARIACDHDLLCVSSWPRAFQSLQGSRCR